MERRLPVAGADGDLCRAPRAQLWCVITKGGNAHLAHHLIKERPLRHRGNCDHKDGLSVCVCVGQRVNRGDQ